MFHTKLGFKTTDYAIGSYKSDQPVKINETDEIHLKSDCIEGSTVNGKRRPIS